MLSKRLINAVPDNSTGCISIGYMYIVVIIRRIDAVPLDKIVLSSLILISSLFLTKMR